MSLQPWPTRSDIGRAFKINTYHDFKIEKAKPNLQIFGSIWLGSKATANLD